MVVLQQRAGERVYVPPGWVHQVTNLRTCLKLAWDTYDVEHFPAYVLLQKELAPLFGAAMAPDYMGFLPVLETMINKKIVVPSV